VLRIARGALDQESRRAPALREERRQSAPPLLTTFAFSYARAEEMAPL